MRMPVKSYSILFGLLSAILTLSTGYSNEPTKWLKTDDSGAFTIAGNISARLSVFDNKWSLTFQSGSSMSDVKKNGETLRGKLSLRNGMTFEVHQNLQAKGPSVLYRATLTSTAKAIPTKQICLSFSLPISKFAGHTLDIDGKSILLPPKFSEENVILSHGSAKAIGFATSEGMLTLSAETPIRYLIQDNRKYEGTDYELRLLFTPPEGEVTKATLQATFSLKPFNTKAIDLRASMNMGFRDDKADDGKGGWTDQGPENDLRVMRPGMKHFYGVPFNVIAPKNNQGKSSLILSDRENKTLPKTLTVPVSGKAFNYLFLLHAGAWAGGSDVYGNLDVEYADGTHTVQEIKGQRDIGDWWGGATIPNGAVVWTKENKSSYVSLYMSRFKVKNKPIKQLNLNAEGNAMWMVVAATGTQDDIPLPVGQGEYYITKNKDWQPFIHSLDVEKGSALDLSFLADAPAGKYGRVIRKGGDFVFEKAPKKPVRFYGSNLCFSGNYLNKDECEKLSENFVRYGYNSLRIHHHDNGMIDPKAPDSLTFDKEQIDKLDYLFYCMKQKGVYITTDIYVSRQLRPSENGIYPTKSRYVKALAPTSELVMQNIKAFAKKWLEHVNPYTGIAWKDDPALYSISFVNENTMYSVWKSKPEVKTYYLAELEKWVKANKIPYSTPEEKEKALTRFSTLMQTRSFTELRDYVKGELGCNALYSDCNMQAYRAQQIARNHFDYVDNHGYWDHPRFPVKQWSMPYGFHNRSVLKRYCSMPLNAMPSRIFGKPFTFTEYNYVFPNIYRSEGSPVMGAYAALQGWNAVYRFAFSHSRSNIIQVRPAAGFDVATDPLTMLGERIVSLMFLRGDVATAKQAVPYVMSEKILDYPGSGTNANGFGSAYPKLGLIHKTGTTILENGTTLPADSLICVGMEPFKAGRFGKVPYYTDSVDLLQQVQKLDKLPLNLYDPEKKILRSDTGEITLEAEANRLTVDAPRSESLVLTAGSSGKAGALSVKDCSTYSTIFAASLDKNPLESSSRILLLHLTDIKNTLTKYANNSMTLLEKNGNLPHLVRVGTARINLMTKHSSVPEVWALGISGKRVGKMEWKDGGFTANTFGKYGGVMAYEIIWKD